MKLKTKKDIVKNPLCKGCRHCKNVNNLCFIYILLNSKECICLNCLVKSMCNEDCPDFIEQFESKTLAKNLTNSSYF